MQRRQILINASMSVIQIIVISGILFVLYKFLLNTIGVEQLGIWSLVLATTAVTQIANFGISGGVVKFVAKYVARGENEKVLAVIQTAALSISVFITVVLVIAYPIAMWVLRFVISDKSYTLALSILPFAFLAFWLMMITGIFHAGLDGYQRIDLRSLLLMGGAILNLLLCFVMVPTYGLLGVAYARIIQNFTMLFSSWFFLKRCLPSLSIFPFKLDLSVFKEMIGYGINFNIISITQMLYDPITKALLSKFGGLSMVGYYEMASRMILQLRALIVSANQVLVPAIADLQEKTPEKIHSVYLTSYQLLFYLTLPLYSFFIIGMPIISKLWIGHYESIFIIFGILLSIGWFFNTLNVPAYFTNLGTGELRWNVISHIVIALLNISLGFILGVFYNGFGVVVAWILSLALGSSIIYLSFHLRYKIPLTELLPKTSRMLMFICLINILFSLLIQYKFKKNIFNTIANNTLLFTFSIIVFISLWIHPMRKRVTEWVVNNLPNKGIET